jgi:hypothetical protein
MSDARLAAANRIIAAQLRALAKAHSALKGISRNAVVADEWLVPVHAAIAEIEGRTSPRDVGLIGHKQYAGQRGPRFLQQPKT